MWVILPVYKWPIFQMITETIVRVVYNDYFAYKWPIFQMITETEYHSPVPINKAYKWPIFQMITETQNDTGRLLPCLVQVTNISNDYWNILIPCIFILIYVQVTNISNDY